jgi:hypothetical protein
VSELGEVATQPEWVKFPVVILNRITAALSVVVVTEAAVAVLSRSGDTSRFPGSISKGPPTVPSDFTPPTLTPEKATIEPIDMSALLFG